MITSNDEQVVARHDPSRTEGTSTRGNSYPALLATLSAVAYFAGIPFSAHFAAQLSDGPPYMSWPAYLIAAFPSIGASYLVIRIGLELGPRVGLGTIPISGWASEAPSWRAVRQSVGIAILLGTAIGIGLAVTAAGLQDHWPMRALKPPTAWAVALASLSAGISEEIWFRLGVMTVCAWGVMRMSARPAATAPVVWSAILIAAGLFGAAHLPQVHAVTALTPSLIAFILAANGAVGVGCGWLYWRRGLLAAMIAHATVDVVLKIGMPLLWGAGAAL